MPTYPGLAYTLAASAARGATAGTNGTPQLVGVWRKAIVLLDVTAAGVDAPDTLDAYVDVLGPDGATWLNAAHMTQATGTGGAKKYFAVLDASAPGTAVIDVTSDCAVSVTRPSLFGPQMRARWIIVEGAGGGVVGFTFGVTAYLT